MLTLNCLLLHRVSRTLRLLGEKEHFAPLTAYHPHTANRRSPGFGLFGFVFLFDVGFSKDPRFFLSSDTL